MDFFGFWKPLKKNMEFFGAETIETIESTIEKKSGRSPSNSSLSKS